MARTTRTPATDPPAAQPAAEPAEAARTAGEVAQPAGSETPARLRPGRGAPPAAAPDRPAPAFVRATRRLITPDGALAHLPGDLVPAQNVDRNGWAGGVEPVDEP